MVKNPGTTARAHPLRTLNQPRPLTVAVSHGKPRALCNGRGIAEIESIQDRWKILDEWWRNPIHRYYHRVRDAKGSIRTIYYDPACDSWFEQAY